jgi:hypothetical protein
MRLSNADAGPEARVPRCVIEGRSVDRVEVTVDWGSDVGNESARWWRE